VLLGVIVLWVCEPIPIPVGGLIGVAAIVLLGVAPSDEVLAPFGSTTVFTFIGAFILAQAMLMHGVAQRLALFVLGLPLVGRSTLRIIIAFGGITSGCVPILRMIRSGICFDILGALLIITLLPLLAQFTGIGG